ncbi:fimbria/pilus outer membrane usher protein [Sphingomonas sp. NFR15]|uniref:fimbria/pilus outer membrane usher protein n=1 Tax=Sphingomonas sp. NFR15 TaxID=1566282 RepID=UPI00087E46C5|nr:fimbria/pilus outer membrane usher protein [Sphingomonas sp. NFR15]SDA36183.1 outer membrane usher protein [Sphingomonas sp. NFR15]
MQFNADFLRGGLGPNTDLARFEKGNPIAPGDYLVDLLVNDTLVGRFNVRFNAEHPGDSAQPCIDRMLLERIGLTAALMNGAAVTQAPGGCVDLKRISPDATVNFDLGTLQLAIGLPQALLRRTARGYVAPQYWSKGIPAAVLAYDASLFRTASAGRVTTSMFAGLTAGVNIGDWHFRDRSAISATNGSWRFQTVAAFVQRDLPAIRGNLVIGDSFTDGQVFDSVGFRGISLSSEDRMRPESQQGYAPVVRGIARTNAHVRITQDGNVLLETNVPPGPFTIDDLYPTGYGGNLLVQVLEADGTQQSFSVPYDSLVQFLRPKIWRYSLAAGDIAIGGRRTGNHFVQAALQYGFANGLTGYAGLAFASGYATGLLGTAVETPLGGFALDATLSKGQSSQQGYSLRLGYSYVIPGLGSHIALAAYRYSSHGFRSLTDAVLERDLLKGRHALGEFPRERNRFQANVTQALDHGWGSFYLSGSLTNFWNQPGTSTQLQAGYNNRARIGPTNLDFGLAFARQRNETIGQTDDRVLLSIGFALGRSANAPRVTASVAPTFTNGRGDTSAQITLSGTQGSNNEYSYSASVEQSPGSRSISLGGGMRARFANLSAGFGAGTGFTQFSLGASGGIVVHSGGVTLANQIGDTIALVEAKGARGATVSSGSNVRIDGAGYAVVPYLMPYRLNEIAVDPAGTGRDVELAVTSQQVAPHANAVVKLKYDTVTGTAVFITARLTGGGFVPFGASVLDARQTEIGLVGSDGAIFLRGIPASGTLDVKWSDSPDARCRIVYSLPPASRTAPDAAVRMEVPCRPIMPSETDAKSGGHPPRSPKASEDIK